MYYDDLISRWNAEMYDLDETETDDVQYLLRILGPNPKRILEIVCGSGRILYPLAAAGHEAVGLDMDEEMLARITLRGEPLQNLHYRKADVMQDAWGSDYDVVVLAGNFLFNIISDMDYRAAQELLIQKAAQALHPGGYLFIDYGYTLYPEVWFQNPAPRVIWEGTDSRGISGRMLLKDNSYHAETGISRSIRRYELTLPDGRKIERELPVVKHFPQLSEVREWLSRAGFVIEQECGDYEGHPISESTSHAILWAKKL